MTTMTTTTDSGPDWAVEQIKKTVREQRQRRHPQLWALSCRLQHQANCLAHQIEDPPPGLDQPFDPAQVLAGITEIRRLCGDIEALLTGTSSANPNSIIDATER